ncbi:MAG: hypothetical protein QXN75_06415 [Thermoproteota archaeon]|nr:hypothetical protein [Candidatus Brockarchaeota archaeon]
MRVVLNRLAMRFVKVRFRIINLVEKEKYVDVDGVVDTRAIYTVVG